MISTVILTQNEESDLPRCLNSISWCDDIHVLDSGSTDNTVAIAEQFRATVTVHPFESFGRQRNFALQHLKFKHPWVLFLDADEVSTVGFCNELQHAIKNANDAVAGFYCCWKMMLEGRWLRRCDSFPKWQFRVVRIGRADFTDFGHGQKEGRVDGQARYIREPYLHFGFSKGWAHWVDRHNRYSSLEAASRLRERRPFGDVFSRQPTQRNPALKRYLTQVPGWPLLRFLHAYVLRFGFLEGKQGLIYCINISYYEFLIKIKMRELKNVDANASEVDQMIPQGDIESIRRKS